tara:strand:- start:958 stop:2376 length:1419 start_codon:yes stop_codon:yes gene_type:complete
MDKQIHGEVVVIGSGPGGYTAAFRAADLGKKVVLVEKDNYLGGVCLNRGCVPSKAFLYLSKIIEDAELIKNYGVTFLKPTLDINKIRSWKNNIIYKLNTGINQLAKSRNIKIIYGLAKFESKNTLSIENNSDIDRITFENCIIATGSSVKRIPSFPSSNKIIYSSKALEVSTIPKKMLIVGAGYIGLEMGSVYNALGSNITVVEFMNSILPGADRDLVKPLEKKITNNFTNLYLSTKVKKIDVDESILNVFFEKEDGTIFSEKYDNVLISIGRKPNTDNLNIESLNITIDKDGFIPVNQKCQTSIPNIFAIGDVIGNPMLAHKASHEGKVAAEVIAGLPSSFEPAAIPAVIFTDPEIAWAGPTENELIKNNIPYKKGEFPWSASAKAQVLDDIDGKTKLLFDPKNNKVISGGIVGSNAGDLIGEIVLAIEMGADAEDIGLSIHPHPTLTETISNASEMFTGTITDLYSPKNN